MILRFPPPDDPWSVNEIPATVKARIALSHRKAAWRDGTTLVARSRRPRFDPRYPQPSMVHVTIPFRTNRRRDPHNYVGTVVKAIVDGLVRAGVWPDDNPDWVTVIEPTLVVGHEVIVRIDPRPGVTVLG